MLKSVADLLCCTRVQAIHGVAVILTPLVFIKQKPVEGSKAAPITLHISYKTLQFIVFISKSNICSSHLFTVKVEKVLKMERFAFFGFCCINRSGHKSINEFYTHFYTIRAYLFTVYLCFQCAYFNNCS